MQIINLRNGTTKIDKEDWEEISKKYGKPYLNQNGYVVVQKMIDGKKKTLRVHRIIMNAQPGHEVDHINRYRTDNRRCNLRICTISENRRNSGNRRHNTSGYRGVSYWSNPSPRKKRWEAYIRVDGKKKRIGYFSTALEAAKAYDIAAKETYGDYAVINGV